jgi:uncharacterized membrane protein YeaQ/YmgE (transglycosylase-associated protein family)
MDVATLLVQLVSGALGGNAAGAVMKKFSLGTVGNSVVGILGGGLGGQIFEMLGAGGAAEAGMGAGSIISNFATGGIGGAVLLAIVGAIKGAMGKSSS